MKSLNAASYHTGNNVLLRPFSDTVNNFVLEANVEEHISVPTGATSVIFSGTAIYYTKIGGTGTVAAIPSTEVTNGSGSSIQSSGYALANTDTVISVISPSACIISMEFYS